MSENISYIGLGGNIGNPQDAMSRSLRLLDGTPSIRVGRVSSIYRTPPWGKIDQPDFLNSAAQLYTSLSPRELLQVCLDTEMSLKRVRAERWGPRVIDIDILMYGSNAIAEEGLEIPHPRMLSRAFVLLPLAEIAPDLDLAGISVSARASLADRQGIEVLPNRSDWWRANID
jgi:2-amino-4-hydroxy-6-hydroxymethyldihydropteridine diphosphokinase